MDSSLPSHQRLLVMPEDGVAGVVELIELIEAAREQLLLKQFKLQSEPVIEALLRAHGRGARERRQLRPAGECGNLGGLDPRSLPRHP